MEWYTSIWRGIMSTNRFICIHCFSHFGQHFWVAIYDTRIIHHFSQSYYSRPLHGLSNLFCTNFKACGLKPRRRRCTSWHLSKNINWLHQCFIMHHLNATQSQDIGYLMWVGEHCRCSMWYYCRRKFSWS